MKGNFLLIGSSFQSDMQLHTSLHLQMAWRVFKPPLENNPVMSFMMRPFLAWASPVQRVHLTLNKVRPVVCWWSSVCGEVWESFPSLPLTEDVCSPCCAPLTTKVPFFWARLTEKATEEKQLFFPKDKPLRAKGWGKTTFVSFFYFSVAAPEWGFTSCFQQFNKRDFLWMKL